MKEVKVLWKRVGSWSSLAIALPFEKTADRYEWEIHAECSVTNRLGFSESVKILGVRMGRKVRISVDVRVKRKKVRWTRLIVGDEDKRSENSRNNP